MFDLLFILCLYYTVIFCKNQPVKLPKNNIIFYWIYWVVMYCLTVYFMTVFVLLFIVLPFLLWNFLLTVYCVNLSSFTRSSTTLSHFPRWRAGDLLIQTQKIRGEGNTISKKKLGPFPRTLARSHAPRTLTKGTGA